MNNQISRLVEGSRLLTAASAGARGTVARDIEALRRYLRERLHGLDPQATDYQRQSVRALILAVLSWQFGPALLQDRQSSAMVASIEQAVAASPEAGQRVAEAIAALTTQR